MSMGEINESCCDDLKFEYEQLVREKNKNFDMSYRIFGLMIPASFVVFGFIADQGIGLLNLVAMGLATAGLWISYGIDRRLTFLNKIKNIRLMQIEEELHRNEGGIWIQRFNDSYKKICDTTKLPEKFNENNERWKNEIINLENGENRIKRFFINRHVNTYILFYNGLFSLVWILLLLEQKWDILSCILNRIN